MSFKLALEQKQTQLSATQDRAEFFRNAWVERLRPIHAELTASGVDAVMDENGASIYVADTGNCIRFNPEVNSMVDWEYSLRRDDPFEYYDAANDRRIRGWATLERLYAEIAHEISYIRARTQNR